MHIIMHYEYNTYGINTNMHIITLFPLAAGATDFVVGATRFVAPLYPGNLTAFSKLDKENPPPHKWDNYTKLASIPNTKESIK